MGGAGDVFFEKNVVTEFSTISAEKRHYKN